VNAIGGKAQSLVRLRDEFGLPVPEFIVIPFNAVITNFDKVQARFAKATASYFNSGTDKTLIKAIDRLISEVTLDSAALYVFNEEILSQKFSKVSFRTSALNEDGSDASFAGQYESFLDIDFSLTSLEEHTMKCFQSMLNLRVLRYAKERGLKNFEIGGSVIVQRMFYGTASGVLFTENGSGAVAIEANDSWRNLVVEGGDSKEYLVRRDQVASAKVPKEIKALCKYSLELESKLGYPLDIEWASTGNKVMFLQMRPVTVSRLEYELDWDSTNISENYPGVTLPLTYSVIRELYAGVYMSFLRMLGTPEKLLRADEAQFRNMLGYLNGHVYYRITNWYELLKFLPGRANQQFFEVMLNPVAARGAKAKSRRGMDIKSLLAILRFLWLINRSEAKSKKFRTEFAKKITFFKSYQLDYVNAAELLASSKKVKEELLADWATPILNDVKLMVFHGILKKYFFSSDDQTEYLNFLQGLTDRASLKPLEQLAQVGKVVANSLKVEAANSVLELRSTPSWSKVIAVANDYVIAFGSRTPGELKLESVRLTDDIEDVLGMALKAYESSFSANTELRNISSKKSLVWPSHIPLYQRSILRWVASNTRKSIDWRERFRFNRAQTFDLSRSLYDSVGKVLTIEGLIKTQRDIYWLTEQEVDEIVNAHAWSLDAKPIIAQRKKLFKQYSASNVELATRGAGLIAGNHLTDVLPKDGLDGLQGKGVAPGVLTAEVIICTEFDPNIDVRGKILVVNHIDPGWTLLFTQAAGIVAERGNALSHAAIIAREIGIPAVVAAPRATTHLVTGEIITINGILGSITREKN
jgi:pyruvate,water dikinase